MSTVKTKNVQIGADGTASNNFTIYQPSTPDGTSRWAVGVSGATTADVVTVNSSGNVGIGTSSFAFSAAGRGNLEIAGSSTALVGLKGGSNQAYVYNDGTSVYVANNSASGNIVFQPANYAERMRIDSSGNVGIGNSSPTYKLDIISGNSNSLNITTNNTNTTIINLTRTNVSTVTHTIDNTGYKLINGGSGGVYLGFTGTSWISLSDERFKTDLKPIENAAEKVSTLRAVTGRFKSDIEGKSRSFLIAQDIQAVLPEAVDTSDPEQLGVSYTDTIPLLVAAIKEQQTIIETLKADIAELKAKVN